MKDELIERSNIFLMQFVISIEHVKKYFDSVSKEKKKIKKNHKRIECNKKANIKRCYALFNTIVSHIYRSILTIVNTLLFFEIIKLV